MRVVGLCLLLTVAVCTPVPTSHDECDVPDAQLESCIPLFETGEDTQNLTLTFKFKDIPSTVKLCKNQRLVWESDGIPASASNDISLDITITKDEMLTGTEISEKSLYISIMGGYKVSLEVNFHNRFRIYPPITNLHSTATIPETTYTYFVITVCDVLGLCQVAISTIYKDDVHISVDLKIEPASCVLRMNDRIYTNGDMFNITLARHAAIQLQSECDLTGTVIESTKQLSVFSGGIHTVVGEGGKTQTFMGSTIPLSQAGKKYVVVASNYSLFGDFIKILTTEDNTTLNIHGQEMKMENHYMVIRKRIDPDEALYVTADKTILISQMSWDYLLKPVLNSVPSFRSFSLTECDTQWLVIFVRFDEAINNNGLKNVLDANEITRMHGTEYMMSMTGQNLCLQLNQKMVVIFDEQHSIYINVQDLDYPLYNSPETAWFYDESDSEGTKFVMSAFRLDPENVTLINLLATSNSDTDLNANDIEIKMYKDGVELDTQRMRYMGKNVYHQRLTSDSPETTVIVVKSSAYITLRSVVYDTDNSMFAAILNHPIDSLGLKYLIGMFWIESSISVCTIVAHSKTNVDVMLPDAEYPIKVNFSGAEYTNNMKISSILHQNTQITLQSYQDLTGTLINADKPVAVFCGQIHRKANDSVPGMYSFVTAEQFPPIKTFGKSFYITPLSSGSDADSLPYTTSFKVIASQHYTVVTVTYFDETKVYEYLEFPGSYIEQSIENFTGIVTSKEALVLQQIEGNEEKSLIIVVPNDQADSTYDFTAFSQFTGVNPPTSELFIVGNGDTSAVELYEKESGNIVSYQLEESFSYRAVSSSPMAAYVIEKSGRYGSSIGNILQSNICVYGTEPDTDCDGLISEDLCILDTYNKDAVEVQLTTPDAGFDVSIRNEGDLLEHTIPLSMYGFRINKLNSINCTVKACNDVRIYLTTPMATWGNFIYEIMFSDAEVRIARIKSDPFDKEVLSSKVNRNCLSCSTITQVSIAWDDDLKLIVPCLGQTDIHVQNLDLHVLQDVYLMTGNGSTGDWICHREGVPSYVGEEDQYLPDFDLDGNLDEDCAYKTPDCGNPEFEHADIEMTDSTIAGTERRSFEVGSSYNVRCRAGFTHSGSTATTCLPTGLWSKEFKCAIDVVCSAPPRKDGAIEVDVHQTYKAGDLFEYKCITGYTQFGSGEIKCGNDGHWPETSFTCSECTCPCNEVPEHIDMTEDAIEEMRDNIRKENLIDKTLVSQYKRKKVSAPDRRFSAKAIGLVGAVFLCMSVLVIILFDVVSLVNTVRAMTQGVGAFFQRGI